MPASPVEGGTQVPIEGLARPECHGWYTDEYNDESSGKLEYVRIEYASRQIRQDSETNGLTLASLGSGTEMHYVMVSNSADDCFEWFGGTASADHLIALNCEDDMFDGDQGFSGKLQFLFGRQYPTTTEVDSRGFEIDGAAGPLDGLNLPYTSEQVSNFTVCGGGPTDRTANRDGAVLRKFSQSVSLENGMVTGFSGSGMYVQADSSSQASMTYVQLFGNSDGVAAAQDASGGSIPGVDQGWFLGQPGNTTAEPDRIAFAIAGRIRPSLWVRSHCKARSRQAFRTRPQITSEPCRVLRRTPTGCVALGSTGLLNRRGPSAALGLARPIDGAFSTNTSRWPRTSCPD